MTLHDSWRCLAPITPPHYTECDAGGEGPTSQRDAEKHVRETGHATTTHAHVSKEKKK